MSIKKILSFTCLMSIVTTSLYADKYYVPPFNSPNTRISISQPKIKETLKNDSIEAQTTPDKLNFAYKFEFEFPVKKWFNLGFFYETSTGQGKWTYIKGYLPLDASMKLSYILGIYGKLQYSPLPDNNPYLNFISKFNCGFGPKIFGPGGVVFRASAEFGIESYFNEWFGVFANYGYIFDTGKETLVGSFDDDLTKGLEMSATGNEIIFGLTTTFL